MSENDVHNMVRLEPFFIGIEDAAKFLWLSVSTFKKMKRNGKLGVLPTPIQDIDRVVYRVDELRAWAAAGCPIRERWQAIRDNY